jgi:hypothetical protein
MSEERKTAEENEDSIGNFNGSTNKKTRPFEQQINPWSLVKIIE